MPTFKEFFKAFTGFDPFPYQEKVAAKVVEGEWPGINASTSAGKTLVILAWVYALCVNSSKVTRRLCFCICRRVCVDDTHDVADFIGDLMESPGKRDSMARDGSGNPIPFTEDQVFVQKWARERLLTLSMSDSPMEVRKLRGGLAYKAKAPASMLQPAIMIATLDQVGSRLLFRGYGTSSTGRVIESAQVYDSTIILDEAHLSRPFEVLVKSVFSLGREDMGKVFDPGTAHGPILVPLTATPRTVDEGFVSLGPDDMRNPIIRRRVKASKLVVLRASKGSNPQEAMAKSMLVAIRELPRMCKKKGIPDPMVIGVVANTVKTARKVFEGLSLANGDTAILLLGSCRPFVKDKIYQHYKPRIKTGWRSIPRPEGEGKIYVISTQCIEVGADLDMDALISEACPLDSARQRWGRVDRDGKFNALREFSVSLSIMILPSSKWAEEHPIYGKSLGKTFSWMKSISVEDHELKAPVIDIGVESMDAKVNALPEVEHSAMISPEVPTATLSRPVLKALAQTNPMGLTPDLDVFIHGIPDRKPEPTVYVCWRADLPMDGMALRKDDEGKIRGLLETVPPSVGETIEVTIGNARRMINLFPPSRIEDESDMSGAPRISEDKTKDKESDKRDFLVMRWTGLDRDGKADDDTRLIRASEVRPGDMLVIPAAWGKCDQYGFNPFSNEVVADIGDSARPWRMRLCRGVASSLLAFDPVGPLGLAMDRMEEAIVDAREWKDSAEKVLSGIASWDGALGPDRKWVTRVAERIKEKPHSFRIVSGEYVIVETDKPEESRKSRPVKIQKHLGDVARRVVATCKALGVREELSKTLLLGGAFHDVGKALDERFQARLHGDLAKARRAIRNGEFLAKSGSYKVGGARKSFDTPKYYRHEEVGAIAARLAGLPEEVVYFIGSHHLKGRPIFPPCADTESKLVEKAVGEFRPGDIGVELPIEWRDVTFRLPSSPQDFERLWKPSAGWPDLFFKMINAYGPWGLALAETIIVLADWSASGDHEE